MCKRQRRNEEKMNRKYHLITDASADLIPEFAQEQEIYVIPMNYSLGSEEHTCLGLESTEALKKYYDAERGGEMTRTSQITPQLYEDYFRKFAEKGESLIYLSLSGGLSSTYSSSQIAAQELMEEFPGVEICCVDSRAATGGMLLLMECAAKNREEGMSIKENAAWLEENRLRVCHWFMVEDLMFLKRGGRLSGTAAVVGTALNIKPILRIENDGTLINFMKKRGNKAALNQLVELYDQASEKTEGERVCIVHADNDEAADYLEQEVKRLNPSCVINRVIMSPIIGCHTGPGLAAIVHFGKRII